MSLPRSRLPLLIIGAGLLVGGWLVYRSTTALPERIVIASGPRRGRYNDVCLHLADRIRSELNIEVEVLETEGSLQNYHLLRDGRADFALYQPDTARTLDHYENPDDAAFVANLYSEVLHVFVRTESGIEDVWDFAGRRVALGATQSGDYAASRFLLDHLNIDLDAFEGKTLSYEDVCAGLKSGMLDAAVMAAGLRAPVFQELAEEDGIELIAVPFAQALAQKHVSTWPAEIPAGFYRTRPTPLPADTIDTISLRAKLLTRPDASARLVEQVTRIVMDEHFQRVNELRELFEQGRDFAMAKPEFGMHTGARNVYQPDLKPLLNPDFVEATEGLRSFVVSILLAGWLVARWLRDRRVRQQEHKLDRYIRSLLDIERRQLGLDERPSAADIEPLQRLLDELTNLRQDALREFTAHELNEDSSIGCFVQMCHALSDKINAKLTRQRFDHRFSEMLGDRPRRDSSDAPPT